MLKNTILIIHHDEISRSTVAQFLIAADYEVLQSETIETANEILAHQPIDVVILDAMLTQTEDVDIIQQLIHNHPCLRVIITAVHSSVDEAVQAMKSGAIDFIQEPHGYVQKPFSARTIQSIVRKTLESPHPWAKLDADYDTLLKTAHDYLDRQDYSQATGFLKEALRCNPERPEALTLLGEIEEYFGNRLDALKKYRAALDLDPTYLPAQQTLHRATTQPHTRPQFNV
ncbi:response regulator [Phormidium sp. FACHB-1136]|uniref:response regulator n=1 Tax=Phormidium sp. FACHB-1136 TaxID=2692848 RepID=UPI0016868C65|nr:response regulator [Phormidium sp. FACHB-1136]MBD2428912.1 response regulator [Phormidium sp. FACHB-1136]